MRAATAKSKIEDEPFFVVGKYHFYLYLQQRREVAVKVSPRDDDSFWLPDHYETESGAAYGILLWLQEQKEF